MVLIEAIQSLEAEIRQGADTWAPLPIAAGTGQLTPENCAKKMMATCPGASPLALSYAP